MPRLLFAATAAIVAVAPGTGCRLCNRDRCDTCASSRRAVPACPPGDVVIGAPAGSPTVSALPTGYVPGSAVVVSDTGAGATAFNTISMPTGVPTPLAPSAGSPANELPAPRIPAPGVPEAPVSKGGNPPLTPSPVLTPIAPARTTAEPRGR